MNELSATRRGDYQVAEEAKLSRLTHVYDSNCPDDCLNGRSVAPRSKMQPKISGFSLQKMIQFTVSDKKRDGHLEEIKNVTKSDSTRSRRRE
jgi:hypothetical protein